ncbi:MAG: hypothetical protein AB7O91_09515 [Sphingomonas sp.]
MSGGQVFVIAIIAMSMGAWIITSWIRARHGYPLDDDWSGMGMGGSSQDPQSTRQVEALTTENSQLKGQVSRLEERIAVLERIATDPAERTAREIEKLR